MMWKDHSIIMGVSATGLRSLQFVLVDFTGMILAAFKHDGTAGWNSEVLIMQVFFVN